MSRKEIMESVMRVTWLGQGGFLLEKEGFRVMIDPYLSNSVEKINSKNWRRFPVDERFFAVKPDVMIFTHSHLDHFDPETVERFITKDSAMTVLAPGSVWGQVRMTGGENNYVLFNRHTRWSQGGLTFQAVKAEHSDDYAIGVIIGDGDKNYYITGDTLYNTEIFPDISQKIHALFLPVNGVGNNMNVEDAALFAQKIGAAQTIPMHYGLFDELKAEEMELPGKRVMKPYVQEEI